MKKFIVLSLALLLSSGCCFATDDDDAEALEERGITATATKEGGMRIYVEVTGDAKLGRSGFMFRSVGLSDSRALVAAAGKIEGTEERAKILLAADEDARTWLSLRLQAMVEGIFLGGATRTLGTMVGMQYHSWLERRIAGNWGHGCLGFTPDGRPVGWIIPGGYDASTIKVKGAGSQYVNASDDDRYREALGANPFRKELAGWLAPDYRNKRLGTWGLYTLLYEVMPQCDLDLTTEIILTVSPANEHEVRLLRKLGFEQVPGEFYRKTGVAADEYSPRLVFKLKASDIAAKKAEVTRRLYTPRAG